MMILKGVRAIRTGTLSVNISNTQFLGGSEAVNISVDSGVTYNVAISLVQCNFDTNVGTNGSHIRVLTKADTLISIEDSTFTNAMGIDANGMIMSASMNVTIRNSNFTKSKSGALQLIRADHVEITDCIVADNNVTGVFIRVDNHNGRQVVSNTFSATSFSRNFKAVHILSELEFVFIHISECSFINHELSSMNKVEGVVEFERIGGHNENVLKIEKSIFAGNRHTDVEASYCSALRAKNTVITLKEVIFTDNNCTGITLEGANLNVQNSLNMTRNFGTLGGAIRMLSMQTIDTISSHITLSAHGQLNIINNSAQLYGGGIYTTETCDLKMKTKNCFFQIEGDNPRTPVITLTGNRAEFGGDAVLGGCLSNCFLDGHKLVNVTDPHNFIHKIVSLKDRVSSSNFAEYSTQVVFCNNETSNITSCTSKRSIEAYRGETFNISLMVSDDFCTPSIEFIKAKINQGARLGDLCEGESSRKYCDSYFYTVEADSTFDSITMELSTNKEKRKLASAVLTVRLQKCPIGFKLDNTARKCVCNDLLNSRKIKCDASSHSLNIPAFTWIGDINGKPAVNEHCQYCHNEKDVTIKTTNDTDKLCSRNRSGILCGKCVPGYSLQLGGYNCAKCSGSEYRGVLLVLGFMVLGVAIVLLLLRLNLTVSTGLINGLIFYSNIVHLNSDVFLPIDRESNNKHLNNGVIILSTFQAWMNLDLGITTCFFDGYDTYIRTWMQFVFPLYIWLLILITVLTSRYSSRISKITTSNTVSVLATLILLAYAKLLTTSIEAVSFTDAEFLHDSSKYRAWILDGNTQYLKGKHMPLFLMSLLTMVIYILPFTLLILLGPLLQTKSHYRLLNWINKLKPFLDAFYGPYTSRYRYWPGILLLARVVILCTFAFYSLGDSPFKLVTMSVIIVVLLIIWMLIGKTENTSLYRRRNLNFLELFFLLNLVIFSVASIYHTQVTKPIRHQQGLAVAMVGSAFAVFCGILAYQILHTASQYKAVSQSRIIRFIIRRKHKGVAKDGVASPDVNYREDNISTAPTHSVVEMKECRVTLNNQLREPLLTN